MSEPRCEACLDSGCVCENHPGRPWAGINDVEECCEGAGMPCPACCSPVPDGGAERAELAFTPDWMRA